MCVFIQIISLLKFHLLQIRELRATLARIEEQAGLREDNLRHEILVRQQM
jgi:hypothetical protein